MIRLRILAAVYGAAVGEVAVLVSLLIAGAA
jgi:hypothetical protein